MRRVSIALVSTLTSVLLLGTAQAGMVEYSKFTTDALLMMRSGVPEEDREAFRAAFLQRLADMPAEERQGFRNKAMTHMAKLGQAERQAMMMDLMQHLQDMSPDELASLGQQFARSKSAQQVMPGVVPQRMMPSYQYQVPAMRMPNMQSYQPRFQPRLQPRSRPVPNNGYGQPVWRMPQAPVMSMQAYRQAYAQRYGHMYPVPLPQNPTPAFQGFVYPGYR